MLIKTTVSKERRDAQGCFVPDSAQSGTQLTSSLSPSRHQSCLSKQLIYAALMPRLLLNKEMDVSGM